MTVKALMVKDGYIITSADTLRACLTHILFLSENWPATLKGFQVVFADSGEMTVKKPKDYRSNIALLKRVLQVAPRYGIEFFVICHDPSALIPEIRKYIEIVEDIK